MEEYKLIPSSDNFFINKDGIVINKRNNRKPNTWVNKTNGRLMVNIVTDTKEQRTLSVAYVLAKTYIDLPDGLTYLTASVYFIDGDDKNISLSNLEWRSKHYKHKLNFLYKIELIRLKHGIDKINFDNGPVECITKPGFYYIKDSDYPLVISKDSELFNLETNEYLNKYNNNGYLIFSIRKNNKFSTVRVNRLMGLTFLEIPKRLKKFDIDDLHINHIDGIKTNNDLDNLEWCTPRENSQHAHNNFLFNDTRVLAKHILNETIIKYATMAECAKEHGVKIKRFARHLKSSRVGTLTKDWFVFKYDDGTDWPELNKRDYEKNRWNITRDIWYAKSPEFGRIVINNTLEGLSNALNLSYHGVKTFILRNKDKPYHGWVIWKDDSPLSEVVDSLPSRKINTIAPGEPISFRSLVNNTVMEFDSITKAANHFNVAMNTITYAIDKRNGMFRSYIVERIKQTPQSSEQQNC